MTEEKVTYSELKLSHAKKKEGKRHLAHKKRGFAFCFEERGCGFLQGRPFCWTRNWYYFSKEEVTWEESRNLCRNMGSSLVKIDDIQELKFIQSQIKYSYWIGLYKKGDKNEWMWQDSTKLALHL
ncbi:killer cell lectin-like receptor 6 [Oryctolagus cuniculus]|uniref:killer cell lectin-like receptor 6 n=1 Tax=Oryctolagus cuniculus TaxID=9986 RepID=UPI00387A4938